MDYKLQPFYSILDCLIIQNNLIASFSYSAAILLK